MLYIKKYNLTEVKMFQSRFRVDDDDKNNWEAIIEKLIAKMDPKDSRLSMIQAMLSAFGEEINLSGLGSQKKQTVHLYAYHITLNLKNKRIQLNKSNTQLKRLVYLGKHSSNSRKFKKINLLFKKIIFNLTNNRKKKQQSVQVQIKSDLIRKLQSNRIQEWIISSMKDQSKNLYLNYKGQGEWFIQMKMECSLVMDSQLMNQVDWRKKQQIAILKKMSNILWRIQYQIIRNLHNHLKLKNLRRKTKKRLSLFKIEMEMEFPNVNTKKVRQSGIVNPPEFKQNLLLTIPQTNNLQNASKPLNFQQKEKQKYEYDGYSLCKYCYGCGFFSSEPSANLQDDVIHYLFDRSCKTFQVLREDIPLEL